MLRNLSFSCPFIGPYSNPAALIANQLSYCGCSYYWQSYNSAYFGYYGIQQPTQLLHATEQRKCEFIAGRYCASQALKKFSDSPPVGYTTQIPIQPNRRPAWPEGFIGSISHSGTRAMAVIGSTAIYSGLGIDCEILLTDILAQQIVALVLHPQDHKFRWHRKLPFGEFVTLIFSAKESLFKALSPTIENIQGFHDFTISSVSDSQISLRPSKRLSGNWSTTKEFSIDYIKTPEHIVTRAIITPPI